MVGVSSHDSMQLTFKGERDMEKADKESVVTHTLHLTP